VERHAILIGRLRHELRQVGVGIAGVQGVLPSNRVLGRDRRRATTVAAPGSIGRAEGSEKPVESAHECSTTEPVGLLAWNRFLAPV